MARRHTLGFGWGLGLIAVGLLGAAAPACSSSTPRDINYGTDAAADFDAPVRETAPEAAETGGGGGQGGSVGQGGAGGAAGAGGQGGDTDAATD
jgi:hypothetical protein